MQASIEGKNATQPMRGKSRVHQITTVVQLVRHVIGFKNLSGSLLFVYIKYTRVGRRFCKLQVAKNKIHFKAMITYENCPKISQNYFPYFTWIISTPVFRKITQIRVYEL